MSRFLSKIAHEINVCDFMDYKVYFRAIYDVAKKEKAGYTYILFTEELGLGKSNLMNLIVNGQRKMSRKNAQIVVGALGLVLERRRYFLKLIELDNRRNMKKREEVLEKIIEIRGESIEDEHTRRQLDFYSHWLHGIVFEMVAIDNLKHTPEAMTHRLVPHASVDDVKASLELLVKLGLVSFHAESGSYSKNQDHFIMDDKIQHLGPIAFHNKMIELARDALVRVSEEDRDVSSMTLAVPRLAVEKLKGLVERFQEEVLAMAGEFSNHDEVYQLNIQLFPLTAKQKRK
ncbi:MAG: TIGR02147 family protein [Silvanigrellaceae bacterium]